MVTVVKRLYCGFAVLTLAVVGGAWGSDGVCFEEGFL